MASQLFPRLAVDRKTGGEPFLDGCQPLPFGVLDFWKWSASDLSSNALRGVVAEYLVAQALGIADGIRLEWAAYDLKTPCGATIEVKSSAYIQTWPQTRLSTIKFGIAPTRFVDSETNVLSPEVRRQADIYVFALLGHQDQTTFDPLNVKQWRFLVLRSSVLDARLGAQQGLSLARLLSLQPAECDFGGLRTTIESVASEAGDATTASQPFELLPSADAPIGTLRGIIQKAGLEKPK